MTTVEPARTVVRRPRGVRPIYIWGAGEGGRRAMAALAAAGRPIAGLVDRDPAKTGTTIEGHAVVAPDTIWRADPRPRIVIASFYWPEIAADLRARGFRRGRDLDVFPLEGAPPLASRPATGDTFRDAYAAWRRGWLTSAEFAPRGTGPAVHVVALPSRPPRRTGTLALPDHLADTAWVVVVDEAAGPVTWRWRSGVRLTDGDAAAAGYDVAPPVGCERRRPFLLRALATVAALDAPLLCRAGALRAFHRESERRPSLHGLRRWIASGRLRLSSADAGLCTIRRPRWSTAPPRASRRVAGAPGLVQFAASLARGGQPVFTPSEVAASLSAWTPPALPAAGARRSRRGPVSRLHLLAHSRGNFFFREIRDFLAAAWRRAGARVRVGDERDRPDLRWRPVVIAPHEFFALDGGHAGWRDAPDVVLVNTEQPQTRWFATCLPRLLAGGLVFDLNGQTARLLQTLGVDAHFLPLGWDPGPGAGPVPRPLPSSTVFAGMAAHERRRPPARWRKRPIDVLFVGTLSPRRARALAGVASTLARYRCFLHVPPSARPLTDGAADALDGPAMADLCRRSKIVLNIHRDDLPYCEWHRVMFHGMRHGALVVSEPMMPVPPFESGRHFVAADLDRLPQQLRQLLDTAAGVRRGARMAAAGRDTLRRRFPAATIARQALALL